MEINCILGSGKQTALLLDGGVSNMGNSANTKRPNNANQRELASKVFIEVGWACDGYKATTALC